MNIDIDKLLKNVSDQAGITVEQARKAVTTVIDELKTRLPAPLVSEVEALFKEPESDEEREKKAALAGVAATTAAVNVVVLPHHR